MAQIEPFEVMAQDWWGLDYEFEDAEVPAFAPVMAAMVAFAHLTDTSLYAYDDRQWLLTPRTDEDVRNRQRSETTRASSKALGAAAVELYKAMESFLRLARERIGF